MKFVFDETGFSDESGFDELVFSPNQPHRDSDRALHE